MSVKRRNFLVKLMKLVGGGIQVRSSKASHRKERTQQQQRTSLPSLQFYSEPLPTIMEEDESPFV